MFDNSGPSRRNSLDTGAAVTLAQQNENGFLQRIHINARYGVNCLRLTLWEYLLLIERASKDSKAE